MRSTNLTLRSITSALLIGTAAAPAAFAQTPSDTAAPVIQQAPQPAPAQPAERPTITISDFDFGTVASQIANDRGTRRRLEKMGIRDGAGFAAALGTGAADLIVEKLLATQAFRVQERKQLAAIEQEQRLREGADPSSAAPRRVRSARYIVTGSVTRLGFEERKFGGAAGTAASFALYGLGAKKERTEVHLTARLIDTETGDIVASFTGMGESSKGWGLTIFGMGTGGFGGFQAGSSNIRESAIGEATERAAQSVVEKLVAARAGF